VAGVDAGAAARRVEPAGLRQLYVAEIKPYHYASVFEEGAAVAFRQTAKTTLRKLERGAPMSLHTRLFLALLAIAFIALVASWPAFAQTEAERKACEPDAQLHCPDEMPDRAKVQACLARKVNSLSPACKQLIENAGKRRHRVRSH
jgi:hypothetical protein